MVSHGMSPTTVAAIMKQLISERTEDNVRWKRAVLLDKLQLDVFRWYYNKLRPVFSTFFSNSTAHFQHYHWREMEPHLFKSAPSPAKLATHNQTILFGYKEMDGMIGKFLDLADAQTTLVFATAMSQQACLVYEDQGGKVMYRPSEIPVLLKFAGVTEPNQASPLMAEVYNIELQNEEDAKRVEAKLATLRVGDRQAMFIQRKGTILNAKCQLHEKQAPETIITCTATGETTSFYKLFFELEDAKSGMHHPDGMFWVHQQGVAPKVYEGKVRLDSVAASLLGLMGLEAPTHMAPPIPELAAISRSSRMSYAGAK
jgi:hypothetical protein